MLGNDLNEFIDDMYHNPEKEISYCGKSIWLRAMLMKQVSFIH